MAFDILPLLRSASHMVVFEDADLKLLLPYESAAARQNKLSREVKAGNLMRLKRGVYALTKQSESRDRSIHPFVVAHKLYAPCALSLESALSYYGLIPEAVHTTTCVTPKPKAEFKTSVGVFTFDHLGPEIFSTGLRRQDEHGHIFLVVHPLRALLDLIYLRNKRYEQIRDLEYDLRVDLETLSRLLQDDRNKEIEGFKQLYKRENVSKVVDLILWELL